MQTTRSDTQKQMYFEQTRVIQFTISYLNSMSQHEDFDFGAFNFKKASPQVFGPDSYQLIESTIKDLMSKRAEEAEM